MFTYRLRDSAGAWGDKEDGDNNQGDNSQVKKSKKKSRFTPTNICDFVVHNYFKGETLLLELKSTQSKSMSFSNLKNHQIIGMYNASQHKGTGCYFIFNFRALEETYAIDARLIKEFWETSDRKSFPIQWVRQNGLLIPQELKRTHFKYEIDRLLNK